MKDDNCYSSEYDKFNKKLIGLVAHGLAGIGQ